MSSSEHTVVVGEQVFALKRWQNGSRPLVALHGWMDNAASWDRVAPYLDGYDVWCLDFAGHGLSDHRPAGNRYHFADHVLDLYGVVEALGLKSAAFIGHSMGAAIATTFAAAFPGKVESVVLVDGLAPYSGDEAEASSILRQSAEEWFTPSRGSRVFRTFDEAVQARMKGLGQISESCSRILCSRGVKETDGGWGWRVDRRVRLASPMRFTEAQVLQMLSDVAAPVLLILAEHGYWNMQPERNEARLAALKNLKTLHLPGGHHLHLEDSAPAIVQSVREFLERA